MDKNIEIVNNLPIRKDSSIQKIAQAGSSRPVSFLMPEEVYQLADAAKTMRDGERNELLILVLFQCCLRVSEALQLTPGHKKTVEDTHVVGIIGKGNKPRLVAIPDKLSFHLGDFAQRHTMRMNDKYFSFTRVRAWQIVRLAANKAGLDYKRVYPHLMRHSGAVTRLMKTGNMKSLQMMLGHSDAKMTMRYQSTMQMVQSLEVESKVQFER